jgi:HPr kinase/phosphorylase
MTLVVHGTAVAIDGLGLLLTGSSGSGKSDLALRLIDRGAQLVGDDYVEVDDKLLLSSPQAMAGKIEVRGIGVIQRPHFPSAPLHMLVELGEESERMPQSWPLRDINGWSVPCLSLNPFLASAPLKAELALNSIIDAGLFPVRLSGG